jgi:carbamoyltransferase
MIRWGVSAGTHDASLCVMHDDKVVFASSSERFSRIKNDKHLNQQIVDYALQWGYPDEVVWYENPILKAFRKIYAGQDNVWLNPTSYMKQYGIKRRVKYNQHHKSHAAGGFYTSGFDDAIVIVIDAIGEWTTMSVWDNMECIHEVKYPDSLGLFYSAATAAVDLKPNQDEFILMAMAAYGEIFIPEIAELRHTNLHRGFQSAERKVDIALTAQMVFEQELEQILQKYSYKRNVVFSGGCALNCVANRLLYKYFDDVWIMPNPGDSGSSLGCLLDRPIEWTGPYLGYDVGNVDNIDEIVDYIIEHKVCGLVNGKAEFGPRALGNRSLLADISMTKEDMNIIKQRQNFRPFAPVILEEEYDNYFEGNATPYMQVISKCKSYIDSITNIDGTSRVQTVNRKQNSVLYDILKQYFERTGTPMLINTSLNIKDEPIVNSIEDAIMFEKKHKIKVFYPLPLL